MSSPVTTSINVQLKLHNKEGNIESTKQVLEWIRSCLNCNTNRVQAEVELSKPVVIVDMANGVIQDITSNQPARVVVLTADKDVEPGQADVIEIDGSYVYWSDRFTVVDEESVDHVLRSLPAPMFYVWCDDDCQNSTPSLEQAFKWVREFNRSGRDAYVVDVLNRIVELPEAVPCSED